MIYRGQDRPSTLDDSAVYNSYINSTYNDTATGVLYCLQVGRLLNMPWVKFVAQATSYLFFLCVILAHGHVEQGKMCLSRVEDVQPLYRCYRQVRRNLTVGLQQIDSMCIRNHKPAAMEFLIVLWITGRSTNARDTQSFFLNISCSVVFNLKKSGALQCLFVRLSIACEIC